MILTIQNFIMGPALPELQVIYSASVQQISNTQTIASAFYLVGSLSICVASMTYARRLDVLYVLYAIINIGCGGIDSVTNVWIVEMWADNCGPYTQGLQFVMIILIGLVGVIANLWTFWPLYAASSGLHMSNELADNINTVQLAATTVSQAIAIPLSLIYVILQCKNIMIGYTPMVIYLPTTCETIIPKKPMRNINIDPIMFVNGVIDSII
ncbi:unnamed protein product [Medioppia subpectinata]|uniref:Uncharacterized protein n=1 Tax=Medioppia subpectinata TaxID=1979941 RepID=A0A7R9Q7Z3_9ACAR|nr:unnamed protein product [Medioppia subpectinata]CAG2114805.1 unnamed protein product [Medioppia subpectinata]